MGEEATVIFLSFFLILKLKISSDGRNRSSTLSLSCILWHLELILPSDMFCLNYLNILHNFRLPMVTVMHFDTADARYVAVQSDFDNEVSLF